VELTCGCRGGVGPGGTSGSGFGEIGPDGEEFGVGMMML